MSFRVFIFIGALSLTCSMASASLMLEEFREFKCSNGKDYAALIYYHGMGGSRGNNTFLGFCSARIAAGPKIVSFFGPSGQGEDPRTPTRGAAVSSDATKMMP